MLRDRRAAPLVLRVPALPAPLLPLWQLSVAREIGDAVAEVAAGEGAASACGAPAFGAVTAGARAWGRPATRVVALVA